MFGLLGPLIQGALTVAPAVEAVIRQRQARDAAIAIRDVEALRDAMRQAWEAFNFHARQRNLTLAAFVVAGALLALSYTLGLTEDMPGLSIAFAATGAIAVLFFNRFDAVHRGQLEAADRVLRGLEARLVGVEDTPELVLAPLRTGRLQYGGLLLLLHALAFWAFVAALVYAVVDAA
jgi:hypothetical protein